MTRDFSSETLEDRRKWHIFQVKKKKVVNQDSVPGKWLLEVSDKSKYSQMKQI